jgi:hypothetical protein
MKKQLKSLAFLAFLTMSWPVLAQPNLPNFIMWWTFCDADGSNERMSEDVCKGGTIYIKNLSTSNNVLIGSALTTGTYTIKRYLDPIDYEVVKVLASNWSTNGTNSVIAVQLPNEDFTNGSSNLRITHSGPGVTPYTSGSRHKTNHLVTYSVSVNAGPDETTCPFQSVVLNGTATSGASFLWNPGGSIFSSLTIFPSSSTVYTLTANKTFVGAFTGNLLTCTGSDQVNVTVYPAPTLHLNDHTLCTGDPMPVLNAGPSPVSYQWAFTASGTTSSVSAGFNQVVNTGLYGYGLYEVTVYDANGCYANGSSQVLLSSSAAANMDAEFTFTTLNGLSTTTISASSTETGTHWWGLFDSDEDCTNSLFPIQPPTTGVSSVTFNPVALNQYYKIIHKIKKAPCNEWVFADRCTFQTSFFFTLSPNPTDGILTISIENYDLQKIYSVSIYDRDGTVMERFDMRSSSERIDISKFQNGPYSIQLFDGTDIKSMKFIKI